MQYKFNNTEVSKERWAWEAHYDDGVIFKQFADDGNFHQFAEIDQSKLGIFRMIRDDGSMQYDLIFNPEEMKLIHYYTNSILRDGQVRVKSYVFGYEKNIDGKVFKSLMTILPSDNLTISDDRLNLVIDIPEQ